MFVIPVLIPDWIAWLRNLDRDTTNRYQSIRMDLDLMTKSQSGLLVIRWKVYRHVHGSDKRLSASVRLDSDDANILRVTCVVNRSRLVVLNRCSMPAAVTIHSIPVCHPRAWPEYVNLIPRRRRCDS